jgi:hypothetical protein
MGATRFFPGGGELENFLADIHLSCLRIFILIALEYSE